VLIFALALAAFQKTEIENWRPIIKAAADIGPALHGG
jgi:hypothetical protein